MNMLFMLSHTDMMEDTDGKFYVIEAFPEPSFVRDIEGNIKCFGKYSEAFAEASDCQDGHVLIFP